jgi:hypothetical protein
MTSLAQKVLGLTAHHLLRQGRKAVSMDVGLPMYPMYHAVDGATCSVGFWIPKKKFRPVFEEVNVSLVTVPALGKNADELGITRRLAGPWAEMRQLIADAMHCEVLEVPWGLLEDLQGIHDGYLPAFWAKELSLLAKRHRLLCPTCVTKALKAQSIKH